MKVHNPNNLPTKSIADLLPTQGDLKDLSEQNYKKLKNTIERRGFSYPVYVWEDDKEVLHLLDGHQRQRVLTTEGWNEPIPYLKVPAKDLQEAMARLLEITSQYATITQEGIDEFIGKYELNEAEVYESTSFDALGSYGSEEEAEIEEDEAPEVDESEPPKSRMGEIYELGRHRVMCADSTVKENVELLMDGQKADLLLTDPPYGIGADTHAGKKENGWTQYGSSGWDKKRPDNRWYGISTTATKNQIIWGGNYFTDILPISQCWLIWDKGQRDFSLADGELAWTSFDKAMRIKTVARAAALQDGKVHPTQKSLEVMVWCIEEIAKDIETVLDPFLGSGSTLIACEQTDRTCFGMELDCKYLDVVRKRWAKYVYPDRWEEEWEQLTPAIET